MKKSAHRVLTSVKIGILLLVSGIVVILILLGLLVVGYVASLALAELLYTFIGGP